MAAPRRILVPVDFTDPSKRACDYALELGAATGAALSLVHVVERTHLTLSAAEHAERMVHANEEIEHAARLLRPYVREVDSLVVEGTPWEGIDATVRDRDVDLIVMGTHGRRGVARALLGSVAARVLRTSSVPVTTVPAYVAASRNDAGVRLAAALEDLTLQRPIAVALSRGALTVATALADRASAALDLWVVEPIVTKDGIVIGAVGEDDAVALDDPDLLSADARDDAIASARRRMHAEVAGLKGTRTLGDCADLDVVLVVDGLFSAAHARVAVDAIRKLGPRRLIVASPIIARDVFAQLEGSVDAVIGLERATVATTCTYRDDVLPSDVVVYDLLLCAPRMYAG